MFFKSVMGFGLLKYENNKLIFAVMYKVIDEISKLESFVYNGV